MKWRSLLLNSSLSPLSPLFIYLLYNYNTRPMPWFIQTTQKRVWYRSIGNRFTCSADKWLCGRTWTKRSSEAATENLLEGDAEGRGAEFPGRNLALESSRRTVSGVAFCRLSSRLASDKLTRKWNWIRLNCFEVVGFFCSFMPLPSSPPLPHPPHPPTYISAPGAAPTPLNKGNKLDLCPLLPPRCFR